MSEQQDQTITLQRPTTNDRDEWKAYWVAQNMLWRTEPEIDEKRRAYLRERRKIEIDFNKEIYPFAETHPPLTRADVEWLLATHDGGPVDWSDTQQHGRRGLDLTHANLREVNLAGLPLANTSFLLADLSNAYLGWARMQGSVFDDADCTDVNMVAGEAEHAHFKGARLTRALMQAIRAPHANFQGAFLQGADLRQANLSDANLSVAHLEGANLSETSMRQAKLGEAHLERAKLFRADLSQAQLLNAHLEGSVLVEACLNGANLYNADLAGASLRDAHLEGANLRNCRLVGKHMAEPDANRIRQWASDFPNMLLPAELVASFLASDTKLEGSDWGDKDHASPSVSDMRWGGANLTVIEWDRVKMLGEERDARTLRWRLVYRPLFQVLKCSLKKSLAELPDTTQTHNTFSMLQNAWREVTLAKKIRLLKYQNAVRANRQVATVLRAQGLNDEADYFAYRANVIRRGVLRQQGIRKLLSYLWSLLLGLIAGYGYKPMRSLITYVVIVCAFAGAYLLNAQFAAPHLTWDEALVLSISAFHGRGFFTSGISLGDTLARLAAGEAIIGLLIEITFIATFTQRFFAR